MASASLNKLIAIAVISLIVASATAQFDNSRERCRHEMQESQLRSCKQFLMQKSREMLMSFTNYGMRERCCTELRDVSPQCRCDAIEEMMSDMREEMEEEQNRHGGHVSRKMMEMAERLPSMCHVSPGYCHMRERLMY
ncbi:2S albumin small chain [Carex littledalei]|uniref:2S albumin small chain n=1 Tax=Carex littledalei TaxID=544730 RepID=A0A833VEC2_9POAL|nr:2S albumin small chain [Carex littledalei]